MDAVEYARTAVLDLVHRTIQKPSERDVQSAVGPSDIGDPCDLCLASKMARRASVQVGKGRDAGFSLKAWIGTAVHSKLEEDLDLPDGHAAKEAKVFIHEIPGYGKIHGHIDLQLLLLRICVDYKTTDMAKLKLMKLDGVPWSHVVQLMLYTYGLRKAGVDMTHAALVYIPRDNNDPKNIWVAAAEYDESIALKALARVEDLWAKLLKGETNFTSDSKCFVCNTVSMGFLR